jgi:acetolactate synthase small subunit
MTHILLIAANRHGVLARVIGVVSSIGANIESARVCPVPGSEVSVIEIYTSLSPEQRDRVLRKVGRLVDVLSVSGCDAGAGLSVKFEARGVVQHLTNETDLTNGQTCTPRSCQLTTLPV